MDGNSILGLWYLYCNSMVGLWMIVYRSYDAPMQKVCDHTPRRRCFRIRGGSHGTFSYHQSRFHIFKYYFLKTIFARQTAVSWGSSRGRQARM